MPNTLNNLGKLWPPPCGEKPAALPAMEVRAEGAVFGVIGTG